jgi:hypothetical protein
MPKWLSALMHVALYLYLSRFLTTITFTSLLKALIPATMPRTKSSTLKVTNLYPLLQDIRNSLGENYVFYKECIVAISRATARGQDASAWFEQSERLVEGVDAVAFSHVGVQFLLREMTRGEGDFSHIRHAQKQTY